jgi:membrane protease YdiL (CAAX protease family)
VTEPLAEFGSAGNDQLLHLTGGLTKVAVTEELRMRTLLLRLLWRAFGPGPALAVAALVLGALHLVNPGPPRSPGPP